MNTFIGIIPARYASTRFPGKPLVKINGKPMVQHVYEQASKAIEQVYIATDDSRIEEAVLQFGGKVIMTSPEHQSGTDRIAEAVASLEKLGVFANVIINIQGDEPFIKTEQIQQLKSCFLKEETQIATLIKKIEKEEELFDTNKPKVAITTTGKALLFSRSTIPHVRGREVFDWFRKASFFKHIGIYAYKTEVLKEITRLPQSSLELAESLEQLRWLENGYIIQTAVTDFEAMAVDTPTDLENLLASLKNTVIE
ncbi:MAG: 3-deoxy-manno-octulosonate cytidylyltransferase [Bacteroidales bacterium]|nr:3-deoxy-manno-octulosonate cytidylyltransferase [Bacteroidales bacterium]